MFSRFRPEKNLGGKKESVNRVQPGGSQVSQRDCHNLILCVLHIEIGCHNCDGQITDKKRDHSKLLQNLQWETKISSLTGCWRFITPQRMF